MVFVAAILDILNIQWLHSANLEQMIEVALVAFMLWILVGIFLIYYAQSVLKDWYHIEVVAHDSALLEQLHNKHKNMYAKRETGLPNPKKLNNLRTQLEYLMLRLIFINPVSLPTMTESYLRKDFNFAMYLAHCFGRTLVKFFRLSMFTLLLLLFLAISFNIAFDSIGDPEIELYIRFSGLFLCLTGLILIRACLASAETKLTPSIFTDDDKKQLVDPHNFDIMFNERPGTVDPFVRYDWMPRMSYLEFDSQTSQLSSMERKQLNDEEERQALLD